METGLQQKRLRQILWLLICFFTLIGVLDTASRPLLPAVLELLSAALLVIALWRNARGDTTTAAWLTLAVLAASLTGLMLANKGLYAVAPMAFPGILIFASMLGSRRMLLVMTGTFSLALMLAYVLHVNGILPPVLPVIRPQRMVGLVLILLVTSVFIALVSSDRKRLLDQVEAEKAALEQSNAQITRLAFHDSLTDLPNRALANEQLHYLLAQAKRERNGIALLFLDLDNFKTINDSLSHRVGDELLRQVAVRLLRNLRGSDIAARLSGDEFLLVLTDTNDMQSLATTAGRVLEQIIPPFVLQNMPVHITCSMGISVFPRDGDTPEVLLKNADLAMYQAKAAGRNTFRFFDESMNANMLENLHLATGLRAALMRNELQLHYQPQIDLATGHMIGAEALLRWQHPEQGWIGPSKFIPIAESSGLIHELGTWVLNRACKDAQTLRTQGLADVTVAINVSPLQFRRGNIDHEIAMALARADLPASAIELEITESVLVDDNKQLNKALQCLRDMGIHITIDDFGTGYSNLAYLQRYAVHRLKIDQSFTRKLSANAEAAGIVQAIIEMAHCLHLQVVAEGVEDAETQSRLQAGGCEFGQGFHWSPALPLQELMAFAGRLNA